LTNLERSGGVKRTPSVARTAFVAGLGFADLGGRWRCTIPAATIVSSTLSIDD
jgi:hypothetical protein